MNDTKSFFPERAEKKVKDVNYNAILKPYN